MINSTESPLIGVEKVMADFDVSRPKAYAIIRELNRQIKTEHPTAIIIPGKVNQRWYAKASLQDL